jgi:Transposase, Mutator family
MPVHRQKKDTTPRTPGSTQEQTAPPLPNPPTFQQYLRELARGAMRVVLEGVMREELDALIGVAWGESRPDRKGYYARDLVTTTGRVEGLRRESESSTFAQPPIYLAPTADSSQNHVVEGLCGCWDEAFAPPSFSFS